MQTIPPSFDGATKSSSFVLATLQHKVEFDSMQIQRIILFAALAALGVGTFLRILQRLLR